MNIMTENDFNALLQGPGAKYYEGRWDYYKEVISIITDIKPASVLELGPGKHTMVQNSDIMVRPEDDAWGRPENEVGKVISFNATEKPWPVADKSYDLFIALQVWEHLDNKQARAFREVVRSSRQAILSFPLMWDCPKDNPNYPEHHMIDEELIADWTLGIKPVKVINIDRSGPEVSKGPRIIYYWDFSRTV